MTKDSIIKAREDFSGNPIRIICDNMIIIWDKVDKNSVVIWDDTKERLISFRMNGDVTSMLQNKYPFTVTYTDYELIQYMEVYSKHNDAIEFANKYKAQLGEDYDKVIGIVKSTMGYQGSGYSGGSIIGADRR